jgi:hypothetical protein
VCPSIIKPLRGEFSALYSRNPGCPSTKEAAFSVLYYYKKEDNAIKNQNDFPVTRRCYKIKKGPE